MSSALISRATCRTFSHIRISTSPTPSTKAEINSSHPSQALQPTNTTNYNNGIDPTSSKIPPSPSPSQGPTQDPSSSSSSESETVNYLPAWCKDNIEEDRWPDEEPYDDPDEPGEEVDNEEDYEENIPPSLEKEESGG